VHNEVANSSTLCADKSAKGIAILYFTHLILVRAHLGILKGVTGGTGASINNKIKFVMKIFESLLTIVM